RSSTVTLDQFSLPNSPAWDYLVVASGSNIGRNYIPRQTGICHTPTRPSLRYQLNGADGVFGFAHVPVSTWTAKRELANLSRSDCAMQENWAGNAKPRSGTKGSVVPTPVYGIVAVGMYMRFYLYDDATNVIALGVPSTAKPLHLIWDHIAIQQILDYIKANH
ncbi:hypothetical protein N7533_004797, partial [Penicillium manginii]|uniref:uncharacterized protein n=1 Tax=Penicillium manginii TaxID=203109 RepID=UPI0025499FBB